MPIDNPMLLRYNVKTFNEFITKAEKEFLILDRCKKKQYIIGKYCMQIVTKNGLYTVGYNWLIIRAQAIFDKNFFGS